MGLHFANTEPGNRFFFHDTLPDMLSCVSGAGNEFAGWVKLLKGWIIARIKTVKAWMETLLRENAGSQCGEAFQDGRMLIVQCPVLVQQWVGADSSMGYGGAGTHEDNELFQ